LPARFDLFLVPLIDSRFDPYTIDDDNPNSLLNVSRTTIEVLKLIIDDRRLDPNARGCFGRTCLHNSSRSGAVDIVKMILNDPRIDPMPTIGFLPFLFFDCTDDCCKPRVNGRPVGCSPIARIESAISLILSSSSSSSSQSVPELYSSVSLLDGGPPPAHSVFRYVLDSSNKSPFLFILSKILPEIV
jgi:ankyrin repeat protein